MSMLEMLGNVNLSTKYAFGPTYKKDAPYLIILMVFVLKVYLENITLL